MGDPRKCRKKFDTPKKMWDRAKLAERRHLKGLYGLKNKKEIWRAETALRRKRQTARQLLALPAEARKKREKELLDSLVNTGALKKNASLDGVLSLKAEALLDRRLQSLVWTQGLSATAKQARQLITHGHIAVNGKKVSTPSYIVKAGEESKIGFMNPVMELKVKKSMQKKERRPRRAREVPAPAMARAEAKKPAEKDEKAAKEEPAEEKAGGKKPAGEAKAGKVREAKKEKLAEPKARPKKPKAREAKKDKGKEARKAKGEGAKEEKVKASGKARDEKTGAKAKGVEK